MSNTEQLQAILRVVDSVIEDISRQSSEEKKAILDHLLRAVMILMSLVARHTASASRSSVAGSAFSLFDAPVNADVAATAKAIFAAAATSTPAAALAGFPSNELDFYTHLVFKTQNLDAKETAVSRIAATTTVAATTTAAAVATAPRAALGTENDTKGPSVRNSSPPLLSVATSAAVAAIPARLSVHASVFDD